MSGTTTPAQPVRFVDLSHTIEPGMVTYKGLPGPVICDYWSREASAANYSDGSSFQIGRIDMVANTGTYLDAPFHRYAHGHDLAQLPLERLSAVPALMVRCPFEEGLAIDAGAFAGLALKGMAVLVHTGWDRHWGSKAYFSDHPFLTEAAAQLLASAGTALVGIDSHNIDDTRSGGRPVHTVLLGADVPICEHMTNLGALPGRGFHFSAVPPKVKGMGTFPVRAHAIVPEGAA